MSVYAVGDIQGCFKPLQKLLDKVAFDPNKDQLWCVGDLVNRGPASLKTLRFLYSIRQSVVTVLGNHDLHLLATYYHPKKIKKNDTLQEVLDVNDAPDLIHWVRQQPLIFHDKIRQITMVHAGIAPQWSLEKAISLAAEVEAVLKNDKKVADFLDNMYSAEAVCWDDSFTGYQRLKTITNYFTRMRFARADGTIEFKSKEGLDDAPKGYVPWFDVANREMAGQSIIFGHWAALQGQCDVPNIYALDTGCVWGNHMTLMNVDTKECFTSAC